MMTSRQASRGWAWTVVVVVGGAAGCTLEPYPSGLVQCEATTACPEGYACLDPQETGTKTCIAIGCGDGIVDPATEGCDDANDNGLDLCVRCQERGYEVDVDNDRGVSAIGFGNGAGSNVALGQPTVIAVDRGGNVFVSAAVKNLIVRIDASANRLTNFAGNGSTVSPLTQQARPNEISTLFTSSMAIDGTGNVFVTDFQDSVIRRIDGVSGTVDIVAGNGVREGGGDGPIATLETLDLPSGVVVDGDGNVFFLDHGPLNENRVRRLDRSTGALSTFAIQALTSDPVPAGVLRLVGKTPNDLAIDARGRLHIFTGNANRDVDAALVDVFIVDTIVRIGVDGGPDARGLRETLAFSHRQTRGNDPVVVERGCPIVNNNQERLVIDENGDEGFYLSLLEVVRLDLRGPEADCEVVATIPESFGLDATFNLSPSDLAVQGSDLVVADPGGGVVWRIPEVVGTGATGVEPVPLAGEQRSVADPFAQAVDELVLELAKQTDAHVGVGATTQCNPDINALDFSSLEFLASFPDLHRVVFSSCANQINVVAGSGVAGFSGDGGSAVAAQLNRPSGAARAKDGNIYIADRDNDRIRVVRGALGGVNDAPTIETFIGVGGTATGDAALLELSRPAGITADDEGLLYISDVARHRVVRVDVDTGEVVTIVGTGEAGFNGDDHAAVDTALDEPTSLVFLPFSFLGDRLPAPIPGGILVIAERHGQRVRGVISPPVIAFPEVFTIAGDGTDGDADSDVDGKLAQLSFPRGLMLAPPAGDLTRLAFFTVDAIDRMRLVTLSLNQQTFEFETTVTTQLGQGPSRDDGSAQEALFRGPSGVVVVDDAHVAVLDATTGRVRWVDTDSGDVVTVMGMPDGADVDGAPVPASQALPLRGGAGIAYDAGSDPPALWITEADVGRLRRVDLVDVDDPRTWTTQSLAFAELVEPAGIAVDAVARSAFVTDRAQHLVLRVDVDSGAVDVVAGVAFARGSAGDGGPLKDALFNEPAGVVVVDEGVLVVADTGNHRLRRLDLAADEGNGVVTAVLGDGDASSGGEGAPASAFPVAAPRGLDVDDEGDLVVTSLSALRFVQSGIDRRAFGDDDVRSIYGKAPKTTFPEPVTRCLEDAAFAVADEGKAPDVFVVDSCLGVLLRLRAER